MPTMLPGRGLIRRRAVIGSSATPGAVSGARRLRRKEQPDSRSAADAGRGGPALRWGTMNPLGALLPRRRGPDWRRRDFAVPAVVLALQVAGTFVAVHRHPALHLTVLDWLLLAAGPAGPPPPAVPPGSRAVGPRGPHAVTIRVARGQLQPGGGVPHRGHQRAP